MKNIRSLLSISIALNLAACVVNGDDTNDTDAADTSASVTASATNAMTASESGSADTGSADSGSADTGSADSGSADSGSADSADSGGGMTCNYTCSGDADCMVAGMDVGLICQDSACALANPCTDDSVCAAQLSGWSAVPCTMGGGECAAAMQICVDLGDGTGGCATPPSDFFMCDSVMGWSEIMVTNLDDGSDATVCGNASGVCNTDTGSCYSPCVDDSTCGTLVCDTDSGNCVCDSDDDCGEGGTCDVAAGTCSVPGCMSDDDCTNPFDGGTISCG